MKNADFGKESSTQANEDQSQYVGFINKSEDEKQDSDNKNCVAIIFSGWGLLHIQVALEWKNNKCFPIGAAIAGSNVCVKVNPAIICPFNLCKLWLSPPDV